jgi:nucleotide-binding universal stress UspA family protein
VTHSDAPFRVVVGVDGSEDARHAADWALHEATLHRGHLVVVHAWTVPALAAGQLPLTVRVDDLQRSAEQLLAAEADRLRSLAPDAEVQTRLEFGSPIAVLIELAAHASLVVVGSRGMGRVAGLLLGSVSQAVVTRAPCPTLVVPPKARA